MNRLVQSILIGVMLALFLAVGVLASDAQMYFSPDKNGQNRVTNVQEGAEIWIVVVDSDENTDCDVRDKIWTHIALADLKTGAELVWISYMDENGDADGLVYTHEDYDAYRGHYPGQPGSYDHDYLEETGSDTGVFVSKRAFRLGTRENYDIARLNTHVIGNALFPGENWMQDFSFGGESHVGSEYGYRSGNLSFVNGDVPHTMIDSPLLPDASVGDAGTSNEYLVGRFENMDTLLGMYQDPNDFYDLAVAMMKIDDVEASIEWDRQIYVDGETAATITVSDWDENLNCNQAEYVPIFILVNPGSWNPVKTSPDSPTTFCALKQTGGVNGNDGTLDVRPEVALRWYSMYHSWRNSSVSGFGAGDDRYYVEYPTLGENNTTFFHTVDPDGVTAVSFYAQETGVNTGIFQLNLNALAVDLGFDILSVGDVLVAYYLDPNDEDDFKLATATIEANQHSSVRFTDEIRADKDLYWIGRDPIYVEVVDANANVDPCCPEQVVVHICDVHGEDDVEWLVLDESSSNSSSFFSQAGMQLYPVWNAMGLGVDPELHEGFQLQLDNWRLEVYNEDDVYVRYNDVAYVENTDGLAGLGDGDTDTAFPPQIDRVRRANDVSFDLMSIGDTQVFDGQTTNMWFLDRQGNRVTEYTTSDCLFIEVLDPDQNEDSYRRERISMDWSDRETLTVITFRDGEAEIAFDLLETGRSTGNFVSVNCLDLAPAYEDAPGIDVQPGDTLIAMYQDPSNHSDLAWISIKIGMGGGGTPTSEQSSTVFVDSNGDDAAAYFDADDIFIKVIDPSHAGATLLVDAVTIQGNAYDLLPLGTGGEFMTAAIDLNLEAGQTITATYTDPSNPLDTSSDTASIVSSQFEVAAFAVSPNPFEIDATFSVEGTGVAQVITLSIYNLAGDLVQELSATQATEIVWDGTKGARCSPVANGCYLYVITASNGVRTFSQTGKMFVNR